MSRDVKIDIDGALAGGAQSLIETLKVIETHDEFSTQAKVREILTDESIAMMV